MRTCGKRRCPECGSLLFVSRPIGLTGGRRFRRPRYAVMCSGLGYHRTWPIRRTRPGAWLAFRKAERKRRTQ